MPAYVRSKHNIDFIPEGSTKITLQPTGRVCAHQSCATVLRRSNPSNFCGVHEPKKVRGENFVNFHDKGLKIPK